MSKPKILVWDWPVRVFHWLLALCVAGAWVTADSKRWLMTHLAFGYTAALLIGLRLAWGLVGTRHARLSAFLRPARDARTYLRGMVFGPRPHIVGHNPIGGWMMLALMLSILATVLSGWLLHKRVMTWDDLHEGLANLVLTLVALHVLAALMMSLLEGENLVRAMITGLKRGEPEQAARGPMRWAGIALAIIAAYGFVTVLRGDWPWLTR